ncbi:hypothetical protein ACJ6WF_22600 [Streptomyces sp. MMS24-I2-30]|uniref:hypothetical protein n=1 Tax=Streptomyces sp. MMS24-I2-30 TaxID=3351564 RepID=UPI00389686B5
MPPQDDDQQRRAQQLAEQRANDRSAIVQSVRNLLENARNGGQEAAAMSLLAQVVESQKAEMAALDVYAAHRRMHPELPTAPPPGLQVALHPASVEKVGGDPLVVTLNTPQVKEEAGIPAPRFLADPHLGLESPLVAAAIKRAGVDEASYTVAQEFHKPGLLWQYQAQIRHREESSPHTPPSQPPQPHSPYAGQEAAAMSLLAQVVESQKAEMAALDVYAAHRRMHPELPTAPPPGLQVALHPASVEKVGGDPLVVTLNTDQVKEEAGIPGPRFLADPHLGLESPLVAAAIKRAGVDEASYTVAQEFHKPGLLWQYQAQIRHREESSPHTPPSQPPQPHSPYAGQEAAAMSLLAQVVESQKAEMAALDVYAAHRRMHPELPTAPPPGLQVALHPASVEKVGGDPLVVTLNTDQVKEEAGIPAPRFLADPHLGLESPLVAAAIKRAGVDEASYTVAQEFHKPGLLWQYQAQIRHREESSTHTPPSQPLNPYATSAAAYLPTTPGTGRRADARAATTQPASGPAWQPFPNNSPAAPANRTPGRR